MAKINETRVAADKTPSLREAGMDRTSVHNDGIQNEKIEYGQELRMDYGLDRSSYVGKQEDERGDRVLAGSHTDLSHSLVGVKAQQSEDKRGRKSTVGSGPLGGD